MRFPDRPGTGDRFRPGAHWASKDGRRNVVVEHALMCPQRGRALVLRNINTNRVTTIEISGLLHKYRFIAYDPTYAE